MLNFYDTPLLPIGIDLDFGLSVEKNSTFVINLEL